MFSSLRHSLSVVHAAALLLAGPVWTSAQAPSQTAEPPKPALPLTDFGATSIPAAPKPVPVKAQPKPTALAPARSSPLSLPSVTGLTLANGLRIWLSPDSELPAVSARLIINAGSSYEPAGKAGLAQLTATNVVSGGSDLRSAAESRRFLAARGAEITTSVDSEHTTLRLWTLSNFTEEVLQHLAAEIISPTFERNTLVASKDTASRSINRRNDDASVVASREFLVASLGTAYFPQPSLASVDSLYREDLAGFHRLTYRPDRAQLVISGDFDPATMPALLERIFGTWKAAANSPVAQQAPAFPTQPSLRAASTAVTANAAFVIGYPLPSLAPADHASLALLAEALNGEPFETLKKPSDPRASATIQSVEARAVSFDPAPAFRIVGLVKVRDTTEAVRDTTAVLDQILAGKLNPTSFAQARDRAIQSFDLAFSRHSSILALYGATLPAWGDPRSFLPAIQSRLASLTPAQFEKDLQRLLPVSHRVSSVAGELADLRTSLETLKLPVTTVDMSTPPAPGEGPATPAQLAEGARQWQRLAAALGITARPVRDAEIRTSLILFGRALQSAQQRIVYLSPAIIRLEEKLDRQTVSYYDPNTAWHYDGFRTIPFNALGVRRFRGEVFRFPFWLAARSPGPNFTVRYLGSGVVRVSDEHDTLEIGLNDKTGLPESVWYPDPAQPQVRVEERMLEYRDFGGVPFWAKLEMYRDGVLVGEITTTSARFNSGLSAKDAAKKPDE